MSLMTRFLDEEHDNTEHINEADAILLLEITKHCRPSMHEPDEQDISAVITGSHFDNAGWAGEMQIVLIRGDDGLVTSTHNLASLVAWARLGAEAYLSITGGD